MTGGIITIGYTPGNGYDRTGRYELTKWLDSWRRHEGQYYVRREDIPEDKMPAHFKDSDKTSEDEKYGTVRYYHIEAGDEVRENAAWYFDGEKAGDMKGWVGLRITRCGDPGNPHMDTFQRSEGDGVSLEEDWFG